MSPNTGDVSNDHADISFKNTNDVQLLSQLKGGFNLSDPPFKGHYLKGGHYGNSRQMLYNRTLFQGKGWKAGRFSGSL